MLFKPLSLSILLWQPELAKTGTLCTLVAFDPRAPGTHGINAHSLTLVKQSSYCPLSSSCLHPPRLSGGPVSRDCTLVFSLARRKGESPGEVKFTPGMPGYIQLHLKSVFVILDQTMSELVVTPLIRLGCPAGLWAPPSCVQDWHQLSWEGLAPLPGKLCFQMTSRGFDACFLRSWFHVKFHV